MRTLVNGAVGTTTLSAHPGAIVGAACLSVLFPLGGAAARASVAPAKSAECPQGFEYKSDVFSCFVNPNGAVSNIRVPGALVARELYLLFFGSHTWSQCTSKEQGPLRLAKRGRNECVLSKEGFLSYEAHERAGGYRQRVTLSPRRLKFEYEAELLVPLCSHDRFFNVFLSVPADTLANRGFRQSGSDGTARLRVFPEKYSKRTEVRVRGLKELRVVLDEGLLAVVAGKETNVHLSDTRSWGGKEYQLSLGSRVAWTPVSVEHPAGTKYRWSFELLFEDDRRKK